MKTIYAFIACLGIISLQAQNSGVSKQDKDFTECALKANVKEQKFSELALRKGFSPEVKELAQHMMADHKKADDLLRELASGRSIALVTDLDEESKKDYEKLSDKEGEAFDMAYTECVAKDHKKLVDEYEKQSKKGENTELRAFANNTLPSIIHHKDMADETCKKLKKK